MIMPNRLQELADSLGAAALRTRERRAKPKQKRKARDKGGVPVPTYSGVTVKAPLVKAAAALDYTVPGLVAPIAQPSGMVCWATVATMMMMWREQVSMTIQAALGR